MGAQYKVIGNNHKNWLIGIFIIVITVKVTTNFFE